MFEALKRALQRLGPRRQREWSVDEAAAGYRIDGELTIRRSEISVIVAFKRDLMTFDQICVGIACTEPGPDGRCDLECIEEGNPTYAAVVEDLARHFDLAEGWWMEVAFPAFEENWTVIWSAHGRGKRG